MKLLISWLDARNDTYRDESGATVANPKGPNINFHENFYKHDKHIVLYSDTKQENHVLQLVNYINRSFVDHKIEPLYISISDPINVPQIMAKIMDFLIQYKDIVPDIYVSPGTPAMQVVWYLSYLNKNFNIRIFQTREGRYSKTGKDELIEIELDRSSSPATAVFFKNALEGSNFYGETLITDSIRPVYDRARLIAHTDAITTLIFGESGTGKESLAKYIHEQSARSKADYIKVNCSAFNDQLLESRLFGYKKGAFTGADKNQEGIFKQADKGTIFLDEIGDISPYMQQVLLRVLQEKEFTPIGGGKSEKVDVRVITATNKNLVQLCRENKFRWDLFYRLSVVELKLPALRDRGIDEVEKMLNYFLKDLKVKLKKESAIKPNKAAFEFLLNYHYHGNVREMINLISRLYVFHEGEITPENLPDYVKEKDRKIHWSLENMEKNHIQKALDHHKGNQRQTAISLGCSVNTLKNKIQKYKLDVYS